MDAKQLNQWRRELVQAVALVRYYAPRLTVVVKGDYTAHIGAYEVSLHDMEWRLIDRVQPHAWLDDFDDPAPGVFRAAAMALENVLEDAMLARTVTPAHAAVG
jgi:hypothetical protein